MSACRAALAVTDLVFSSNLLRAPGLNKKPQHREKDNSFASNPDAVGDDKYDNNDNMHRLDEPPHILLLH